MFSESLKSADFNGFFCVSDSLLSTRCKGKYALTPEGELKLLSIQEFSEPRFRPRGWERHTPDEKRALFASYEGSEHDADIEMTEEEERNFSNISRAVRRAKIACFDYIQCNPELDTFATLTLDPRAVSDRADWDEAYKAVRGWLSNRVQRRGLLYIMVPEHHHDGESIHFHAVMNSAALRLEKARYPDSGRLMKHRGQQVYNISDFEGGFTTAKLIDGESATDKVSKYIFKYMGKQMGTKIGGRFYLHGGKLRAPLLRYADDPGELLLPGAVATHTKELDVTDKLHYKERYFV